MNDEVWKPVDGFEGRYEVSSQGRVRSLYGHGRVLAQRPGGWGKCYARVGFRFEGKLHFRSVHRLVCTAFHGEGQAGNEARHLNGDPLDNRAENLAWGSRTDQRLDDIKNGVHSQARKTHCPRGHAYDGFSATAGRYCRTCKAAMERQRVERNRAKAAAVS